jgi:predicted metal-dependent enzyme (double-stranded beta helix superfamily)
MKVQFDKLSYRDALESLVAELAAISAPITADALSAILERSALTLEDVASHVEPTADTYTRRRIARSDHFEVLVLTWMPGQGGGAHDHSDSLSGFKILKGTARETLYVG